MPVVSTRLPLEDAISQQLKGVAAIRSMKGDQLGAYGNGEGSQRDPEICDSEVCGSSCQTGGGSGHKGLAEGEECSREGSGRAEDEVRGGQNTAGTGTEIQSWRSSVGGGKKKEPQVQERTAKSPEKVSTHTAPDVSWYDWEESQDGDRE